MCMVNSKPYKILDDRKKIKNGIVKLAMFQVKDIARLLQTATTGDEFLSSKVDSCSACMC
jgi:hypothetical protein